MLTDIWCGNLEDRIYLEDTGVRGRVILKRILKKWARRAWSGLIWLQIGTRVRLS